MSDFTSAGGNYFGIMMSGNSSFENPVVKKQADEITRLRAEVAGLREALVDAHTGLQKGIHQQVARTFTGAEIPRDEQQPWVRLMQIGRDAAAQALASTAKTAEAHDRAVRNEALEEAAKVADDFPKTFRPKPPEGRKRFSFDELSAYSRAACRMVGEDIRALKGDK